MTAPRVVFVLVAYNQARWVRQACEAALNQDYGPLEILFSDDASTDETFAIMQAVANHYSGPHKIRLNRNPKNLGLIGHVNFLNTLADADLLIAAAGDDISLPERTRTLVEAYQQSDGTVYSFHSSVHTIDGDGTITGRMRPPLTDDEADPLAWMTSMGTLIGATHAWTRPLYERFGPISEHAAYEDLVLAYRAMLVGKLQYIDAPLVMYRQHVGVSSQTLLMGPRQELQVRQKLEIAVLKQRRLDCIAVGQDSLADHLARHEAGLTLFFNIALNSISAAMALKVAAQSGLWPFWINGYRTRLKQWRRDLRQVFHRY